MSAELPQNIKDALKEKSGGFVSEGYDKYLADVKACEVVCKINPGLGHFECREFLRSVPVGDE